MRKLNLPKSANPSGVGIDIIDSVRIQSFLRRHPQQGRQAILTRNERKEWQKHDCSPILFSKLFAAKEAFFKASGKLWMGLEGFRKIEVKLLPRNRFRVGKASGQFFTYRKRWVGAHAIVWN